MFVLKFERRGEVLYAEFFLNGVKMAVAEAPNTMVCNAKLKLQKVKKSINGLAGYVRSNLNDELGSIKDGFFIGSYYSAKA